jgi:hypothetical protein
MKVRASWSILLFLSTGIFLASCQKEASFEVNGNGNGNGPGGGGSGGSGNTTDITGNYDFVGISAHTVSTVIIDAAGDELKTISTSDYASDNNAGTVTITSNQMNVTGIAYSISSTVNGKTYLNNSLISDIDAPFDVTVPPSSSNSTYTRISNDSIRVSGGFGSTPDPSGAAPTGPVGVKLSWSGDTLLLKIHTTISQTISQGGVPAQFTGTVIGITKLKKK